MSQNTMNPYPLIGIQLTNGLDAIIKTMNSKSSTDDLVDAIYNYIQPIYYPGKEVPVAIQMEIKSVAYNVINTYINNTFSSAVSYDASQDYFISLMLCSTGHKPINTINTWLLDVEDNIAKSGLPIDEQTPLLLTTMDGRSVYLYWLGKIEKPGKWANFFNSNAAINYANIPFWTEACMAGSLIGASASPRGLISPTTDITTVEIVSSLIGALAIGAGVVIFQWIPRINTCGFGGDGMDPVERKKNTGAGSFTLGSGGTTSYAADYITATKQVYYWS